MTMTTFIVLFLVSGHPRELLENYYSDVTKVQFAFSVFVIEGFVRLKEEHMSKYKYNTVLNPHQGRLHTKCAVLQNARKNYL